MDLFWIFFLDIFLVTFLGYRSIPATKAWLGEKKEHCKLNHDQENIQKKKDTESENQDDFMFMRIFAMFEIVITLKTKSRHNIVIQVPERLVASALVGGLHDNCLSPCIPAL